MATNKQQSMNYKMICLGVFLLFLALVGRWWYLKISDISFQKLIASKQTEISNEQKYLASFSEKPGFDKLQYVKQLEKDNKMMPWSDHINAIMEIFSDLLAVDNSDTFNIAFSDFEISLESIKLNWYVTNLRLLYQWSNSMPWLIERFEKLDFLDDISIKTYEKSEDGFWYDFTLIANVINNAK